MNTVMALPSAQAKKNVLNAPCPILVLSLMPLEPPKSPILLPALWIRSLCGSYCFCLWALPLLAPPRNNVDSTLQSDSFGLVSLIKALLASHTRACFVYGTGMLSKSMGVSGQEMFPPQSFIS